MNDEYKKTIELLDEIEFSSPNTSSLNTRKRRIQDSNGIWHEIKMLDDIQFKFDKLIGLGVKANNIEDMDIIIMDAVLEESKKTGLPLNICFQSEIIKRDYEAMLLEIISERQK